MDIPSPIDPACAAVITRSSSSSSPSIIFLTLAWQKDTDWDYNQIKSLSFLHHITTNENTRFLQFSSDQCMQYSTTRTIPGEDRNQLMLATRLTLLHNPGCLPESLGICHYFVLCRHQSVENVAQDVVNGHICQPQPSGESTAIPSCHSWCMSLNGPTWAWGSEKLQRQGCHNSKDHAEINCMVL